METSCRTYSGQTVAVVQASLPDGPLDAEPQQCSIVRGFFTKTSTYRRSPSSPILPEWARPQSPLQEATLRDQSSPNKGRSTVRLRRPVIRAAPKRVSARPRKPISRKKVSSCASEIKSYKNESVFEESDEEHSGGATSDGGDADEEWEDTGYNSIIDKKDATELVDSLPSLTPGRSLLTSMMDSSRRATPLQNGAIMPTPAIRHSPNSSSDSSFAASSVQADDVPEGFRTLEVLGPTTMAILNTHPEVLSPRQTRQNMISNELPKSFRKCIHQERQMTRLAPAKLPFTAEDNDTPLKERGNRIDYFHAMFTEYHQKGW